MPRRSNRGGTYREETARCGRAPRRVTHASSCSANPGCGVHQRTLGRCRRRERFGRPVPVRDLDQRQRGAGVLLRRRPKGRFVVRHIRRRRPEARIRPPEHHARSQSWRATRSSGTYRNNRPNSKPQAIRMRRFTPVALDGADAPALAGSWEMRRRGRRGVGASRHADVERIPAAVGRGIDGHDSSRGRRHRHARRPLAERQAGAQPLRRRTPEALRSDAQRGRHAGRHAERNAHYLVVRKGEARAKGIPEPPDPSRYTSVKDPTAPFQFAFPDLTGKIVSGHRRADSAARS